MHGLKTTIWLNEEKALREALQDPEYVKLREKFEKEGYRVQPILENYRIMGFILYKK